MARDRLLPKAWPLDEDLATLAPLARLLFHYLHNVADKAGRLEDRPKRIRVECLPYDTEADVDELLAALDAHGAIRRYRVDGARFIAIPTFAKTQRPHLREAPSEIPPAPALANDANLGGKARQPRQSTMSGKANLGSEPGTPVCSVPKSESKSVRNSDPKSESLSESESEPKSKSARARATGLSDQQLDDRARRMFAEGISRSLRTDELVDTFQNYVRRYGLYPTKAQTEASLSRVLTERTEAP